MNKKISANEFRESLDRHASCLKANPWLAQGIIASEMKGETKVKRKLTTSVIIALLMILTLGTAAYGVTSLYRSVNWQGEEKDAGESTYLSMPEENVPLYDKMMDLIDNMPEDETVGAWFEDGRDPDPWNCILKPKTKSFRCIEDFVEYMSGVPTMTAPVWFPKGEYESFYATVKMICGEAGEYELLESGEKDSIHYVRYRLDDEYEVPFEYTAYIDMVGGKSYCIESSLWTEEKKEAGYLDEKETVEKITVKGMDEALLFHNRRSEECDMTMRRKLDEPVRWKQIPGIGQTEGKSGYLYEEYISVWAWRNDNCKDELVKLFNGDDGE